MLAPYSQNIIRERCLLLIKHFGEDCNHWYDHSHYLKLKVRQPLLAEDYARTMFNLEVFFKLRPSEVIIRCSPYDASQSLYLCANLFPKTHAYINKQLEKTRLTTLDMAFLEIFDLPKKKD